MRRHMVDSTIGGAVLGLLLACLPQVAKGQGSVDLSNLPPHPRVLLIPSVWPAMQAEAASGPKVGMFAEVKRRADDFMDDPPGTQMFKMVCLAVTGRVTGNPAYLQRAASDYVYTLQTNGWAPEVNEYAYIYDWVYDYLTPEQRAYARELALDSYSPGGQRTVYYNLEANEASDKGLVGLIFYGDGDAADNALCQQLVDEWDGRMRGVRQYAWPNGSASSLGGVLPTRDHCFPDGGYYKGNHYTQKDMEGIITYLVAFDQCGLGDYWDIARDYLEDWPEYMYWVHRPDDYCSRMMSGKIYGWERRGLFGLAALATYIPSPLAQRWLHDQGWSTGSSGGYDWGFMAILWRPQDPGTVPLPLHKFYGASGSTNVPGTSWSEKIFVRSGWSVNTNNDDVYFTFQAGDYFGDYFNFYQLGFEIYYRGALAIRSGYYQEGGFDRAYYGRALSNNCVVVLDQSQDELGDIWGQDWLYGDPGRPTHIYEVADDSVYDTADIIAFSAGQTESGRPYYYAKGMLKPDAAYYYSNDTRRVSKQEREVVVDGRYFVVRDRVELSGGTNSVRWLLHTINEPVLESPTLLETTVPGHIETYARTRYSAERTENVGVRDYDGKITVVPVVPANATLRKVGGSGYETWIDDGEGNGQNWDIGDPARYTDVNEVGQWRMETIAPTGLVTDFVHALWVGRPGQTMPAVQAIEDESSLGCEIDGVGVYVFARTPEFDTGLDYHFQGSLVVPHVIEGLAASTPYAVEIDGARRVLVSDAEGGLTFDAAGPAGVRVAAVELAAR